ncbi:MAG: hypothetical protein F6J93_37455 [Oscillatoria sp. SIO1A7]|nr:hypothetical protein [Oscillatoria sp. SIO1A7]
MSGNNDALAGALADRLARFPNWESKPPVQVASGDLVYPEWMAGTWEVTSTLVDMVAPLAPDFVSPGFESNRRYLNQPTKFQVRFGANKKVYNSEFLDMMLLPLPIARNKGLAKKEVVADRAFNGLKIAQAYLGDRAVLSVKVDPHNPNRQITLLRGNRQLVSVTSDRSSEIPGSDRFIATEISQQVFRGESQIYFNEVETTTAYLFLEQGTVRDDMPMTKKPIKKIEADQATAIYLSPQDADYFVVPGRPVALYRYRLELSPVQ